MNAKALNKKILIYNEDGKEIHSVMIVVSYLCSEYKFLPHEAYNLVQACSQIVNHDFLIVGLLEHYSYEKIKFLSDKRTTTEKLKANMCKILEYLYMGRCFLFIDLKIYSYILCF